MVENEITRHTGSAFRKIVISMLIISKGHDDF
jgi:hypothetical protein